MNVRAQFRELLQRSARAVPLAYYPGRKLIGATMGEILSDSTVGAECLTAIQNTFHPAMLVRMTELWVEAEAFGAQIEIPENAFPVIKSKVIPDIEDMDDLQAPDMGAGRLPVLIETVKKTRAQLPDALLFAGVTGAFSLGGCLTDAQELMISCYTDPETVHAYIGKITDFLIGYCNAYKEAGASGVFLAEPSICMLSPDMAVDFSHQYTKKIIDRVQDKDFAVVYHNCGDVTPQLQMIRDLGAMAYHFGDAVPMQAVLELFPENTPILGNIHPAKFTPGNEEVFETALHAAQEQSHKFPNYILSSGCDLAPDASIELLHALCRQPAGAC